MEHTFSHHTAYKTMLAAGLGSEISLPILRQVQKWIVCNGPEWAVTRIKTLKACYLHKIAGKTLTSRDTGFRMHDDGTPYGPFRALFRLSGNKGRIKALNALMSYTGVTLHRVTKVQWKKFHTSVMKPRDVKQYGWAVQVLTACSPELQWSMVDSWNRSRYIPLQEWCRSAKRAPLMEGSSMLTKPEMETSPRHHLEVFADPFHQDLLSLYSIPFERSCQMKVPDEIRDRKAVTRIVRCPPTLVGRIGFIQERGCKLRAVANPFRVHQAALSRLGNALFDFLRTSCPWDCTFDQNSGVRRVSEQLARGRTVYSVDLSDATNQFPLDLQMKVLTKLLADKAASGRDEILQSLNLFADVSRAKWHIPLRNDIQLASEGTFSVRWVKGQPLGLYPSFAAFAITHGLLLKSIELSLGLQNSFVVLGDDVCIWDDTLNKCYRQALDGLGCPVSELKTLESTNVAEFAGRIITGSGALPVEKWKRYRSDDPLCLVRQFGLAGLELIPKKYRDKIRDFVSLPEPVGLGLNPCGYSLEERMSGGLDSLYWPKLDVLQMPGEERTERFMDLVETYQPYLAKNSTVWRKLGSPTYWPTRPSKSLLLKIEHLNAVIQTCKAFDVSDHLLNLRDNLQRYLKRADFSTRPADGWYREATTRLSVILKIVQKMRLRVK